MGLVCGAVWLAPSLAYGQSQELVDAYNQGSTLYGQGRYEAALPFHRKAVRLGEEELGPNHPTFATLLNSLGLVYGGQGRYAEAEPLPKCASDMGGGTRAGAPTRGHRPEQPS